MMKRWITVGCHAARFLFLFCIVSLFPAIKAAGQTSCASGDIDCLIREETVKIQQQPNAGLYLMSRANLYKRKKAFDLAIADYNQALVIKEPTIPTGHFEDMIYNYRGDAYFQKGDYDNAIRDFTTLIDQIGRAHV